MIDFDAIHRDFCRAIAAKPDDERMRMALECILAEATEGPEVVGAVQACANIKDIVRAALHPESVKAEGGE